MIHKSLGNKKTKELNKAKNLWPKKNEANIHQSGEMVHSKAENISRDLPDNIQ